MDQSNTAETAKAAAAAARCRHCGGGRWCDGGLIFVTSLMVSLVGELETLKIELSRLMRGDGGRIAIMHCNATVMAPPYKAIDIVCRRKNLSVKGERSKDGENAHLTARGMTMFAVVEVETPPCRMSSNRWQAWSLDACRIYQWFFLRER